MYMKNVHKISSIIRENLDKIPGIIVFIILGFTILFAIINGIKMQEEFVEYDNTVLAVVEYGEKTEDGSYNVAFGFVDKDIYNKIKKRKNKEQTSVEFYDPYQKDISVVIKENEIHSISAQTYKYVYEKYPPHIANN